MTDLQIQLKKMKSATEPAEIKRIYKNLAFQYHPDLCTLDTTEIMAKINDFFVTCLQNLSGAVLTNHITKKTYTYQADAQSIHQYQETLQKLFGLSSDVLSTEYIIKCFKILDLELLDHIIFSEKEHTSLKKN